MMKKLTVDLAIKKSASGLILETSGELFIIVRIRDIGRTHVPSLFSNFLFSAISTSAKEKQNTTVRWKITRSSTSTN